MSRVDVGKFMERKIEGVTVCVDYADFLEVTLPQAMKAFDNVIVVTSKKDKETQKLARGMGAEVVVTNSFYEAGAAFNKGKGINEGFRKLRHCDWVCHFDSDIYFPNGFRKVLNVESLDETFMYGIDRMNIEGREKLQGYLAGGMFCAEDAPYDSLYRFHNIPLGYFQLFNWVLPTWYPEDSKDASESDLEFVRQWDGAHRKYLDNQKLYHLVSKGGKVQDNWKGRKSPRF